MSIFKRIRDIVDARINDLLDEFDDPIATGNQMIREIENLIVEMRRNVTAAIAMPYLTEIRLTKKRAARGKRQGSAVDDELKALKKKLKK